MPTAINFPALPACIEDACRVRLAITRPSPVDWVQRNRYLPAEVGTPLPGQYSISRTPYLREILNRLHDTDPCYKITLLKSAQIGFTVGILENAILWIIGACPAPVLYATATDEVYKNRMQLNIEPAIDHAGLRNYLRPTAKRQTAHNRLSGDKMELKQFEGGYLVGGSIQKSALAKSYSIRYLLLDEIDSAPGVLQDEGDIIRLFIARTQAYISSRKILIGSTPRVMQTSRVWQHYTEGDQRKYYVPCKHCGTMQPLSFEQLKFKDSKGKWTPDRARYHCVACDKAHTEGDKHAMLAAGEWRATAKPSEPGAHSYHLSALYSPSAFYTWARVARDYVDAYRAKENGDISPMRDFINLKMGLPWEERGGAPNASLIELSTRNSYRRGQYPDPVIFTTIGADVQGDRIEAELLGWDARMVCYSIDYFVLTRHRKQDSIYELLRTLFDPMVERASNHPHSYTCLAAIDANYMSSDVYAYCSDTQQQVMPILGTSAGIAKPRRPIVSTEQLSEYPCSRLIANVDLIKDAVYTDLRKDRTQPFDKQQPFTCNFPCDYPSDYYKQLTAESKVTEPSPKTRQPKVKWIKTHHKNEALDCRVYAIAAMHRLVQHASECWQLDRADYTRYFQYIAEQYNTKKTQNK